MPLVNAISDLAARVAAEFKALRAQVPSEPLGVSVAPEGFAFPYGQAVSRTGATAALFAVIGTTYGAGDGSTTYNMPDLRGRVTAAKDNMGGAVAGRLTTVSNNLGTVGGAETHTLTTAQIPAHNHGVNDPGHAHTNPAAVRLPSNGNNYNTWFSGGGNSISTNPANTGITIANAGGGAAHPNLQPTIVVNKIIKL